MIRRWSSGQRNFPTATHMWAPRNSKRGRAAARQRDDSRNREQTCRDASRGKGESSPERRGRRSATTAHRRGDHGSKADGPGPASAGNRDRAGSVPSQRVSARVRNTHQTRPRRAAQAVRDRWRTRQNRGYRPVCLGKASPRSSEDRAPASGAGCAGSSPAGGTHVRFEAA